MLRLNKSKPIYVISDIHGGLELIQELLEQVEEDAYLFLLGDYFEDFINSQIKSGKYASASEVIRAALRMFEHQESKKEELIRELKKGEKSGLSTSFDRENFKENLRKKHVAEK